MKFAILNISNDMNKGDLAILESVVLLTRKHFPDAEIDVLNTDYDQHYIRQNRRFKHLLSLEVNHHGSFFPRVFNGNNKYYAYFSVFKNLVVSMWILGTAFIFRKHAAFLIPKRKRNSFKVIQMADLVILNGGCYLYSYGGLKQFLYLYRMVMPSIISIWLGKKVIALGHSVGPVENGVLRTLLRYCLNRFHQILVREEISHQYVIDVLKINKDIVQIIPDLAFFWNKDSHRNRENKNLKDILEKEGINCDCLNKLKIGLTVRRWNFPLQNNPKELFKNYISSIISVINRLNMEYGAKVFIMPHVQNDIELGLQIAKEVEYAKPIVFQGDYSTSTLRELYGMMDVFIGTRIHSNIFALSVGTPVIGIAYHIPKGVGIISTIESKDCILDIVTINEEVLWQTVKRILSQRFTMNKKILAKVEVMKQSIEEKYAEVLTSALIAKQDQLYKKRLS